MPLDALCLSGVVAELKPILTGAKIDKVHQPGRDEMILALRLGRGNGRLLLSASPNHPRLQMTELSRENPDAPPMFCMLLRKHLMGGRILSVEQPHLERIVELRLEVLDELGDRKERRLILEAMGRRANLVLVDDQGRIVDCLRRVDFEMSQQRQVLPGLYYHLPPRQDKCDPLTTEEDAFRRLRLSARSYHGIIRTARTIADLDGAVKIGVPHISEAICFRSADKSIWRI